MFVPLYSAGNGLNGAVNFTAFRAAWSAAGNPEERYTLQDNNCPFLAILNKSTTFLLSLPFGGCQLNLILLWLGL